MKLPTIRYILSALLIISSYPTCVAGEHSNLKEAGICLAIVGAVGAAVGGIMTAVGSWFTTSNATLIAQGHTLVGRFNEDYNAVGQKICNFFQISNLTGAYNWQAVHQVEGLLYDIALNLYTQKKSWRLFNDDTYSFLCAVKKHQSQVSDRIAKMYARKNNNVSEQQELQDLRSLEVLLSWVSLELSALYQYLCVDHATYFKMAEKEWILYREYSQEITVLEQSTYNTAQLERELSVLISQRFSQARYPFMTYQSFLHEEISALTHIRKAVDAYRYPERCAWTDGLLCTLNRLAAIVEPWYRYQLSQYEADEIERKKFELEREKIALIKEQNAVIYQQNRVIAEHTKQLQLGDCADCCRCQELHCDRALVPQSEVALRLTIQ